MNLLNSGYICPSDWQSYLCRVNNELASVFVDLSLAESAPRPEAPKLAWLSIQLRQPCQRGLSTDEEFDALCTFEDELEVAVCQHSLSAYAGRITSQGRRDFYFYVAREIDFARAVDSVRAAHPEYPFQLGEKAEQAWDHYFHTLFPGAIRLGEMGRHIH
jgi:hypothetical protein